MRWLTVAVVASSFFGCAARPSPGGADDPGVPDGSARGGGLICEIVPPRGEAPAGASPEVGVRVTNRGDAPAQLDLRPLSAPQTALVVTRDGKRVAPMSPPVPREASADDLIALQPGASHVVSLRLDAFSPPLSPGSYLVRCASPPSAATVVTVR